MLTVHHLGHSQSERVIWLCEELNVPYALKRYERDANTRLAPPEYKALHPTGTAPVITDGNLVLGESGAILDYIMAAHAGGGLALPATDPRFADYLYWFHFANGTLQPAIMRDALLDWTGVDAGNRMRTLMQARLAGLYSLVEGRLGDVDYLAGAVFTAADIMVVFSLTTMRLFRPVDLSPYPNILAYLQRIGARDAYRRAMRKGDPDLVPLLT